MKNFLAILILLFCFGVNSFTQNIYFPPKTGNEWASVSPESLGWHIDKIDSLYDFLDIKNTKAFIVLKDGKIVLEHYFDSFTQDSVWYWASAGKTLTAFLTGIAQEEGYLSTSDLTSKFLGTGWTSCPPEKENLITIRHQLTMSSGLNDESGDSHCTDPACLIFLKDAGTRWAYHNAPYTLLEQVIENATGKNYNLYTNLSLKNKTGMTGLWIKSGYNNVFYSTPRSMARYGILIQNKAVWDRDTLLHDTSYFNAMVNTSQNLNLSYGYLWWLNGKESYMMPQSQFVFNGYLMQDAPSDMISALGKNGQILNVVPSKGIVVVRMGDSPGEGLNDIAGYFSNDIWKILNEIIDNPVSVDETSSHPAEFTLEQNYPNPFNPVTTINYSIPSSPQSAKVGTGLAPIQPGLALSVVILKVYDILGNEIATLVNGPQEPGSYEVNFSVTDRESSLTSGVYFYRLQVYPDKIGAGNFVETKKMILLK